MVIPRLPFLSTNLGFKKVLPENLIIRNIIETIYEDEQFVIFNKPSGLLVIPSPNQDIKTLRDIVNNQFVDKDKYGLHPCHRLDRETSGAIIFAKGKANQKKMMELFFQRQVYKKYIAFVNGYLKNSVGTIRLSVESLDRKRFGRYENEKMAVTKYKVLEKRKNYSIIDIELVTGRSNQARIHFSKIGHPIIGDRKYSIAKNYPFKFKRTALHSFEIKFKNPVTNKLIEVKCRLPKDMEEFIERN